MTGNLLDNLLKWLYRRSWMFRKLRLQSQQWWVKNATVLLKWLLPNAPPGSSWNIYFVWGSVLLTLFKISIPCVHFEISIPCVHFFYSSTPFLSLLHYLIICKCHISFTCDFLKSRSIRKKKCLYYIQIYPL